MRRGCFLIVLALASSLSCNRDTVLTVASVSDATVLISEDQETMERIIECSIARACGELSVTALLAARKVFRVPCGTKVTLYDGFTFGNTRKIRVLEGEHAGRDGWVYERMLAPACSGLSWGSEDRTAAVSRVSGTRLSSVFTDTYRWLRG